MTNKECIHDLKIIKKEFEKQTGGCSPVCLEKAINVLEDLEKEKPEIEFGKF